MIKQHKWTLLFTSIVILLPILFGLMIWEQLPEQMVTHWGEDGTADGWSSREVAVFVLPICMLAGHWICAFCTSRDPKNKHQSGKVFDMVLWIFPVVSLFVGGMIYAVALGKGTNPYFLMSMFVGLMYVVIGNYLPKCKQNHTIGIKVKWALEDEENWNATHRFGGKVWVIGGILMMISSFLPEKVSFYFLMGFVLVPALLCGGYSYHYSKKSPQGEPRGD